MVYIHEHILYPFLLFLPHNKIHIFLDIHMEKLLIRKESVYDVPFQQQISFERICVFYFCFKRKVILLGLHLSEEEVKKNTIQNQEQFKRFSP